MSYTPKFTDPRVRAKCLEALAFVEAYVSYTKPNWLSTREIGKHLGWQGRPLGKFLKDKLLICTDPYFNATTGKCKEYKSNPDGVRWLKQQLNVTVVDTKIDQAIQEQLSTGDFDYQAKSNREYHPLQNLPKRIKRPLFISNNYNYEYDIQCCAHTLILQQARKLGLAAATPELDRYINNRSLVREELAQACNLTVNQVKYVLTAILQGAMISHYHGGMILKELGYNHMLIDNLKENQFIVGIQRDIRECWRIIKPTISVGTITDKNGNVRSQRLNGKHKSAFYRELEESVRVVIQRDMRKNKNRHFFEHDGWTCEKFIDPIELCVEVKRQTGFVIELSWTAYEE